MLLRPTLLCVRVCVFNSVEEHAATASSQLIPTAAFELNNGE